MSLPARQQKPHLNKSGDFYQVQHDALALVLEKPRLGLFLSPGLGKTTIVGHAVATLLETGEVRRVLYLCPPRCVGVMRREAPKWEGTAGLHVVDVTGTPAQRLALLKDRSPGIYCLSFNLAGWLLAVASQIPGFQMLIVDESSKVASAQAKTTHHVARFAGAIPRIVLLNGTPYGSGAHKIWSQILLIDFGERLGEKFSTFASRYLEPQGFSWHPKPNALSQITTKIQDICFSANVGDHTDKLPSVIRNEIVIELPPEARRIYEELEEQFISQIAGEIVKVGSPIALTTKLMQAADGIIYGDDGSITQVHTAKLDAIADLVEEAGDGDPSLIIYRFRSTGDALMGQIDGAKRFQINHGAELDQLLEDWGQKKIPALISHYQSLCHGIDGLQRGGRRLIWVGPIFSSDSAQQTEARLHRVGGKDTVIITTVRAAGTIDDVIAEVLRQRIDDELIILDVLGQYLKTKRPKHATSIS